MKKTLTLFLVGLFMLVTSQALAVEGDVGSEACRDVQLEAQEAVGTGGPYKNHGKMVSTAAKVVSPYEDAGDITCACASCIVSQFAQKIPVDEQIACGVDCEGKVCGTYTPDCNPDISPCFCWKTDPDGDTTICADDFLCDSTPDCVDGACDGGRICVYDSCCGEPKCVLDVCTGIIQGASTIKTLSVEGGGTGTGN